MLLAALALASMQGVAPLEQHVREAECIVVGRVERVHDASQSTPRVAGWPVGPVPIAEVVVTRVLLGEPGIERVFVLAARPRAGHVEPILAPHQVGVLFLDPDSTFRAANELTRKALAQATGEAPLYTLRADGAWLAEDPDTVRLPRPDVALPHGLFHTHGPPEPIGFHELVVWTDRSLDRVAPAFSATLVTTGPVGWSARVDADGTWHVGTDPLTWSDGGAGPATDGVLDEQAFAAFHAVLDVERFHAHPPVLGRAPGPDSSFLLLRLRSRRGVARVEAHHGLGDGAESAAVAAARRHLAEILAALPGDTAFTVPFSR